MAALVMALLLRRGVEIVARREVQATRAAADLAREGTGARRRHRCLRASDELLGRVAVLDEPTVPVTLRREADRVIAMIEAVNPLEPAAVPESGDRPSG